MAKSYDPFGPAPVEVACHYSETGEVEDECGAEAVWHLALYTYDGDTPGSGSVSATGVTEHHYQACDRHLAAARTMGDPANIWMHDFHAGICGARGSWYVREAEKSSPLEGMVGRSSYCLTARQARAAGLPSAVEEEKSV